MARSSTTTAKRRNTAQDGSARAIDDLGRLIANPEKHKLRWWFDVGQLVLRLHPQWEPGAKGHYGAKTTLKLAQQFRPADATKAKTMRDMLVQARKLALRFDDWKRLEKFQGNLSIWHVMSLLAVDKAKGSKCSMAELHKRCLNEGWSVDRLKREVQNDRGGKAASGRRPMPLKAATPAIAIKDLFIAARRWTTYHDQCLAGRSPLLTRKRGARYDQALLDSVEKTVAELQKVQGALENELAQLDELSRAIKAELK